MKSIKLVAILVVFSVFSSLVTNAAELVHEYTFDDMNGNDSVGTLDADTTLSTNVTYVFDACMSNNVAVFNGVDSFFIFARTNFGDTFSISTWIKPNNHPVDLTWYDPGQTNADGSPRQQLLYIIGNKTAGHTADGFGLYINNNWNPNSDGSMTLATGNGTEGANTVTSGGIITTSGWNNIVYVVNRTGSWGKIYYNGSLLQTGTIKNDFNSDWWWKMGTAYNGEYYFDGKMDDIRIYSGLLTAEEVEDLYGQTKPPVNYYHRYNFLDDNADDFEGDLNGALVNNPTFTNGPLIDLDSRAIILTGDQYIHFPATDFGDKYTIASWVYLVDNPVSGTGTDRDGRQKISTFMANCLAGGQRNGFQFLLNNEWVENFDGVFQLASGDGSSGTSAQSDSTIITNGQWYHIAAVLDASNLTVRMFINGEVVVDSGPLKATFQRIAPWSIGANDVGTVNSFQGMIADVRLYSRILTDGEIHSIYENLPEPGFLISVMSLLLILFKFRK